MRMNSLIYFVILYFLHLFAMNQIVSVGRASLTLILSLCQMLLSFLLYLVHRNSLDSNLNQLFDQFWILLCLDQRLAHIVRYLVRSGHCQSPPGECFQELLPGCSPCTPALTAVVNPLKIRKSVKCGNVARPSLFYFQLIHIEISLITNQHL